MTLVGCGYCMTCGYGGEPNDNCLHKKEKEDNVVEDIEFDSVIQIHEDGSHTKRNDIFAPDCYLGSTYDIDFAGDTRWEAISGYSGQDHYNGPIMHASEIFAGPMAKSVLSEPGIYTLVVVTDIDDGEPAGWAALKMKEENE